MDKKNTKRWNKGFTIIELLIGIVLFGILAAIAIPSMQRYVLKSHRSDGINALNSIQLQQEKYRSTHSNYATIGQLPGGSASSPYGYYAIAIVNPNGTSYTATATAQGSQANDTQGGTSCAVLTLVVNGLNTTQTPQACWTQ
jgi:type IV pilus assembly protein PilE